MYGHEFKKLRKMQNITQKDACQGICSESKLSRWENDQVEVEFSTAMKLLAQIHINSYEFMGWSEHSPFQTDEIEEVTFADVKKTALQHIDRYNESKKISDLLAATPYCNKILLESGQKLLSDSHLQRLYAHFSKITFWSHYYINYFGGSIFLLESRQVYGIAMQILRNFDSVENEETSQSLIDVMGGLGDAVIKLIFDHQLDQAKTLLTEINKVELPRYLEFFNIVNNFISKVIHYLETGDEQPVLAIINSLILVNCKSLSHICLDVFKHVQKAWEK